MQRRARRVPRVDPHVTRCIHEDMKRLLRRVPEGRASDGASSAAWSASLSTFYPDSLDPRDPREVEISIHRLIAKRPPSRVLRLQALDRAAVHVPAQRRSSYVGELPAHDVREPVRGLRADPGHGEGARPAAHPARRPRAELHDEHRAAGRLVDGEPVRAISAGINALWGPLPRRREPGRDRDARGDPRRGHDRAASSSSAPRAATTPRG